MPALTLARIILLLQPPKTLQTNVLCIFVAPLDNTLIPDSDLAELNLSMYTLIPASDLAEFNLSIYTINCFKCCYMLEKVSYTMKKNIMSALPLSEAI